MRWPWRKKSDSDHAELMADLRKIREAEIEQIKIDYSAGHITRNQARQRLGIDPVATPDPTPVTDLQPFVIPEGKFVFDPLLDTHLESDWEDLITKIGPRMYLRGISQDLGVVLDPPVDQLTDYDCRRVIRGIVRNSTDYPGKIPLQ